MMPVSQTTFRQAIFDPEAPMPEGLVDADGVPDTKRFDVYRNNVAVSLTEALQVAFPVIYKLVGKDFFQGMAGIFLRKYPPNSPMLMQYGAEFPGFIRGFQRVGHLKYLPGIARLEQSLRHAYHAADHHPIDASELQSLSTEELMNARLILAPAVTIVRSDWPIHGIWQFNMVKDAPDPVLRAEDVLVTRPDFDPIMTLLPESGAEFILALQSGKAFGVAMGIAKTQTPTFDLGAALGALISGGAITAIIKG